MKISRRGAVPAAGRRNENLKLDHERIIFTSEPGGDVVWLVVSTLLTGE